MSRELTPKALGGCLVSLICLPVALYSFYVAFAALWDNLPGWTHNVMLGGIAYRVAVDILKITREEVEK